TGYIILEQSLCVLHDISDKETVLIDSGYFTSPELLELLKARGKRVPAVLCTHLHVDHIGNNGLLQRTFGSKIYVARKEKEIMEQRLNHQGAVPFKWMEPEKYFFGDSGICRITAINDKDKAIKIGGAEFKIERLSGHSPDHLGFATPDGVLHIGDSMMTDMVLKKSKIPYEFNITSALETLERFKVMDYPYFAASHMDVVLKQDMPKIAGENIAFHNKVLDEMEKNLDVWKEQERFIEETITGRGVHIRLTRNSGWLPSAIRSYLGHLIRQGRITRKTENGKKYIKRITIKAVEK
ncbi:MAG: MBL fold metallo-hydrolase, partial [Firmicutes bacterium]|nr:MBL fold metallo-hydrolase [Bacillota bacterium]